MPEWEERTCHVVIVPRLAQIIGIAVRAEAPAEVTGDGEVVAESLNEPLLAQRLGSLRRRR